MREFIIESALLTHGLKSISSEHLKQELDKKWKALESISEKNIH